MSDKQEATQAEAGEAVDADAPTLRFSPAAKLALPFTHRPGPRITPLRDPPRHARPAAGFCA